MENNNFKPTPSKDLPTAESAPGNQSKKSKNLKNPPSIDIYKTWCKGCGLCASFCPTGALARDEAGYPYVKDIDKCIDCGLCEIRCPDFAITVRKQAERGSKKHDETEKTDQAGTAPPG